MPSEIRLRRCLVVASDGRHQSDPVDISTGYCRRPSFLGRFLSFSSTASFSQRADDPGFQSARMKNKVTKDHRTASVLSPEYEEADLVS